MNRDFDSRDPEIKPDGSRDGRNGRNGSTDNGNEQDGHCKDSHVRNWHPDYSLSSQHAREWHKQNEKSKHQSVDLKDGIYTVKHGDALSTIAARELKAEGKELTKKSIAHEVKEIVALNHEKYKDLDCNKEYLGTGWKLKMPHAKSAPDRADECSRPSTPPTEQAGLRPPQSSLAGDYSQLPPEPPAIPPQVDVQRPPQLEQQFPFNPEQILGQVVRSFTQGNGNFGNFGQQEYGFPQYPGDRQGTGRLAQDLLQGNVQDAIQVLRLEIARGNGIGCIQQANQIADQAAAQQGARSPLHVAVRPDGDVDIVDQFGRRIAEAGNIYGRQGYGGYGYGEQQWGRPGAYGAEQNAERYAYLQQQQQIRMQQQIMQQQLAQQQLMQQQQFAQHQNWRSGYGTSGNLMAQLQNRNQQIQQEAHSINPPHTWQPNPLNVRRWGDSMDDPGANQALNHLRQHGIQKIFG